MTLPHEAEAVNAIAAKYQTQLAAMTDLHNAVVGMMTQGSWTVPHEKTRGLTPAVVITMMGLLTKACKTFRAIQLLSERGLALCRLATLERSLNLVRCCHLVRGCHLNTP
jgi:hypothetical protein